MPLGCVQATFRKSPEMRRSKYESTLPAGTPYSGRLHPVNECGLASGPCACDALRRMAARQITSTGKYPLASVARQIENPFVKLWRYDWAGLEAAFAGGVVALVGVAYGVSRV